VREAGGNGLLAGGRSALKSIRPGGDPSRPRQFLARTKQPYCATLAIASLFLPPTGFKFGRTSKPDSHYFYRCANPGKTVKLKGIDGRTLLECRGNGGQTVVPPSVHETGELIEFTEMADPGPADFNDLLLKCRLMAAAIEIAPHWRNGSGHDLSRALQVPSLEQV
jgi:Bifunctional DNA primase/polymerase, N-terminal